MFNWKRFCSLAKVNWMENRKFYAWFFAIGIAVHFCVVLLFISSGKNGLLFYASNIQTSIFWIGYFLSTVIFSGLFFSVFSKRETALTALMLPASTLEKFILSVLVVVVLYPIAYMLAFQVINIPVNLLALANYVPPEDVATKTIEIKPPDAWWLPTGLSETVKDHTLMPLLLSATILQALMLSGALFFKRQGMLKTLLVGFVVFLALIAVSSVTDANSDYLFKLWTEPGALNRTGRLWMSIVWSGVVLLLWATVYLHLKTKELK